jgi:hypothetical protein
MSLRRKGAALSLAVLTAVSLTGCGGGSATPAAPATPGPASAKDFAAIAKTWSAFFSPVGSIADHQALLENGDRFAAELTKSAKDPNAANLSANLLTATVFRDQADVTYDLLAKGGVKLLTGAQGVAVRIKGQWKVGQKTYCTLIKLSDPSPHPACV